MLSAMLVRTTCHTEPFHESLCSIGHFTWASNLDLPMACCTMSMCKESKKIMRLFAIFGMHECQVLWMGVSPALDTFQGRIDFTSQDVLSKPSKTYFNDILAALKDAFEDHMQDLDNMFTALN